MARFTFGPQIGSVTLVAATGTTKADVAVAFAGSTPDGLFHFAVPSYDLTTSNQLNAVHVGLYATTDVVPTDASLIVGAPHHFSFNCSALTSGGQVTVDGTEAPEGTFNALAVLEWAS